MGLLADWLEADHRAIDALFARVVRGDEVDHEAYRELRARLLRHIAIEEKVVLAAVRERQGGVPLARARRLRIEHGALTSLLVPSPDPMLIEEIVGLLEPHNRLEEGPGGVYEECEQVLGDDLAAVLEAARAYPPVKLGKHYDGPRAVRTAAAALRKAERMRFDDGGSQPAGGSRRAT